MMRFPVIILTALSILAALFASPAALPGPQERQRPTIRRSTSRPRTPATLPDPAQPPATATLSRETELEIRLSETVSSKENEPGDEFEALLDRDVRVGGDIVIPRRSLVFGKVLEVRDSGRVKGRAKLSLTLTQVIVRGETYPLRTNTLEIEAEGGKGSDAKKVGVGSGLSGLLGGILGGGGGLVTGTIIGAGAGTAGVLLTKGKDVSFGPEHRFVFHLQEDMEVSLY